MSAAIDKVEEVKKGGKREVKFEFRLTEAEYEALVKRSESYNSVSDYIRKKCLTEVEVVGDKDLKIGTKTLKEVLEAIRETNMQIQKLGVNVNQTGKHINFLERHNLIDANIVGRMNHNYIQVQTVILEADKTLRELINRLTRK